MQDSTFRIRWLPDSWQPVLSLTTGTHNVPFVTEKRDSQLFRVTHKFRAKSGLSFYTVSVQLCISHVIQPIHVIFLYCFSTIVTTTHHYPIYYVVQCVKR